MSRSHVFQYRVDCDDVESMAAEMWRAALGQTPGRVLLGVYPCKAYSYAALTLYTNRARARRLTDALNQELAADGYLSRPRYRRQNGLLFINREYVPA